MLIYGELQSATLENLASDPPGNVAGRIWNNTTEVKVKMDDGALKRALLKNDQHLVIGNSATASQNTRLHRGAANLLQFVKADDVTAEGTPSTSLTQVSARMENYTDAGLPAFGNIGRLAYITDTTSFAFDNGSAWDKIRLLRPQIAQAVLSKTATYAALVGDGTSFNDATGGSYAITLPAAAAANNGESLDFVKITTDTTFNVITLTGVTGGTLNTAGEKLRVRSNGGAWVVEDRYIPSNTFSATFGLGSGLAATAIVSQTSFAYRNGSRLIAKMFFVLGNTSAAGGTLSLPSGLALDTSFITNAKTNCGVWWNQALNNQYGSTNRFGLVFYDGSNLSIGNRGTNGGTTALSINTLIGGGDGFAVDLDVPISGWNG